MSPDFIFLTVCYADSPTEVTQNPMPKEDEINWILDEVSHYLSAGNLT